MSLNKIAYPPEQQDEAVLDQATPVQNTWYTVLDTTKNCRIILIDTLIATTNETLEIKVTVDGIVLAGLPTAHVANTSQTVCWAGSGSNTYQLSFAATGQSDMPFLLEGKSVKIEIRKTTAAGAGNLQARVIYALY